MIAAAAVATQLSATIQYNTILLSATIQYNTIHFNTVYNGGQIQCSTGTYPDVK